MMVKWIVIFKNLHDPLLWSWGIGSLHTLREIKSLLLHLLRGIRNLKRWWFFCFQVLLIFTRRRRDTVTFTFYFKIYCCFAWWSNLWWHPHWAQSIRTLRISIAQVAWRKFLLRVSYWCAHLLLQFFNVFN
jgi:hypothetical protein